MTRRDASCITPIPQRSVNTPHETSVDAIISRGKAGLSLKKLQIGIGKVELLGVQEINFSNPEFRTCSTELEEFWRKNTIKYITNVFGMINALRNTFITVQRIQVIWMFPFQRDFNFGAVQSADEKHLSADTNVVVVTKYFITNFCIARSCVAV